MGTRGLMGVRVDGVDKLTYNHWDSYPSGLGQDILEYLQTANMDEEVEKAKIEIGDRGTESYALRDHKAFLFDKNKNLLVIPILLAEINEGKYLEQYGEIPDHAYGEHVWQGAYVLNIDLDGISVRGKITHDDNQTFAGRYYYAGSYAVKRSLYMDDYLYTVSDAMVKANNLQTILEINSVEFSYKEREQPVYDI